MLFIVALLAILFLIIAKGIGSEEHLGDDDFGTHYRDVQQQLEQTLTAASSAMFVLAGLMVALAVFSHRKVKQEAQAAAAPYCALTRNEGAMDFGTSDAHFVDPAPAHADTEVRHK